MACCRVASSAPCQPVSNPPVIPILIVCVISVLGINADVDLLFSIGSFGALVAFPVVNLAVIKHYLWGEKRRTRKNVVLFGVLPGIGCWERPGDLASAGAASIANAGTSSAFLRRWNFPRQ